MTKAPEGLCFRFLIGEYHTTETIGESQLLGSLFTGWQGNLRSNALLKLFCIQLLGATLFGVQLLDAAI